MARQAARAQAAPALLSIGQVLARLTPEFPDLSSSKLRFLEERGLITPARTASGYRKFSAADLERLRVILGMQRDHYLPLKVIKTYLTDLDAGLSPALPGSASGPSMLPSGRRFKRVELLREAGASAELLRDAVTASVIAPAEVFGEESLAVLKALVELQRNGIEPRHLRGFRAAAERELGLIETALVPIARRNDVSSRAKTAELAREISGQLDVVRGSIIRSALGRLPS
ncbi:transcriptional regulator FtsR [Leifsonia poae]|uniref:transcriptional regulator FtsR n=1 Tax=Leifsonia poae TaxID=110933 RepID=UPI001CBB3A62|nr:MerR family transcriptional regulator [Leifsonia poae]